MVSLTGEKGLVSAGSIFTLGVALLPVYVFSSGGVQPSHMILAVFSVFVVIRYGLPLEIWVFSLLGLSVYSFFLEGFYSISGDSISLMSSLFLAYSTLIAASAFSYCKKFGLTRLMHGVLVSCLVSISVVVFSGFSLQEAGGGRSVGGFNNPNQLGFYSVCLLSIVYLLYRHGRINYFFSLLLFCTSIFLSILSLSKAAMIANFVVVLFALKPVIRRGDVSKLKNYFFISAWCTVIFCLLFTLVIFYYRGGFDNFIFVNRLQNMMYENDSSMDARGYFAILQGGGLHVLFGLGIENVIEIVNHEVHSTLGSVLNRYGIIGLFIFLPAIIFWMSCLWRAYGFWGMCCLTGPAMLYGLTHNGIRFTFFWVLFGSSMAMAYKTIHTYRKLKVKRTGFPEALNLE